MKIRPLWFILLSFLISISPILIGQAPSDEDPEFVEARRLFWSGQYLESEKTFKSYLQTHPDHEASKSFLQMIVQSRIHDESKISQTRERLEEIVVRKLDFKNSDWRFVTAYLQILANPKTADRESPGFIHFINLLPSGYSTKISFTMEHVTIMQAIERVCQQAGLRYVIDTWAVIIDLPEMKK